jgi:sterol desaturase/sphingolipid hydroxylase (fatty acid hydroxylase superfamily)
LAVFIAISFVFSKLVAATFFAGFLTAMIAYDCIHYYCHFGPELEIQWLKKRRINHLKHHYRNQSKNYGVTTNIWDKVFGTYECDTKK